MKSILEQHDLASRFGTAGLVDINRQAEYQW